MEVGCHSITLFFSSAASLCQIIYVVYVTTLVLSCISIISSSDS